MSCSERRKELKRRRHRKKTITKLKVRAEKGSVADKAAVAGKIRRITPGGEEIISRLALEER